MTTTTTIPAYASPKRGQLLKLDIPDEKYMAATVPVRWCVSARLVRLVRERDFEKPYVLLVVRSITTSSEFDHSVDKYQDTLVRAVPLLAEMSYISFSRPGRNEVRAVVVDLADKRSATIVPRLRGATGRYYGNDFEVRTPSGVDVGASMLHHDGTPKWAAFEGDVRWIDVKSDLEVDVPAEMFAPPPPAWLKRLVKAYYRTSEFDQCHFRERAIISVVTSVVWMPIAFGVKILATLVALFLGLREIPYKTIIRPLELNPLEPVTEAEGSVWRYQKKSEHGFSEQRPLSVQMLTPPVLVLLPLVVYVIAKLLFQIDDIEKNVPWLNLTLKEAYLYTIGGLIILAIIGALLMGLVVVVGFVLDKTGISSSVSTLAQRRRDKKEREAEAARLAAEERRKQLLRELMAMTCNRTINPGEVDLTALPKEKQTFKLRFYAVKTKVCRPFAKV